MGVPERTIRRWVNDTLLSLAQEALDLDCDPATSDTPDMSTIPTGPNHAGAAENAAAPAAGHTAGETAADTRATPIPLERQRALAIERQLAVAVTAHAAYDRLMARHDDLLDALTTVLRGNVILATEGAAAPASLPPAAALLTRLLAQLEAGATRHLRIAQAAHREAARFQGVAAYAQTDARLTATEAHAHAEPDDDAEHGVHYVPIKWVDPNDPNEVGLIPRHTFDANAAIDELVDAPRSSLDKLQQTDGTKNNDDDAILAAMLVEQAALTSPAAPSATGAATAPATPSVTPAATASHTSMPDSSPRNRLPGTGRTLWRSAAEPVDCRAPAAVSIARSVPATGMATVPATSVATNPATRPLPSEGRGQGVRTDPPATYLDEREYLREPQLTPMGCLARARIPPTLPRSNTVAALFLHNPHYVF